MYPSRNATVSCMGIKSQVVSHGLMRSVSHVSPVGKDKKLASTRQAEQAQASEPSEERPPARASSTRQCERGETGNPSELKPAKAAQDSAASPSSCRRAPGVQFVWHGRGRSVRSWRGVTGRRQSTLWCRERFAVGGNGAPGCKINRWRLQLWSFTPRCSVLPGQDTPQLFPSPHRLPRV